MHLQDNRYADNIAEQIKKGTTTCALTCVDGVVLAADTRASAGFFIADKHVMKIQKIDRHLGMTIAGGEADANKVCCSTVFQHSFQPALLSVLCPTHNGWIQ